MKYLRLTESDLKNLIRSSVNNILMENNENNKILSQIVQGISQMGEINAHPGDGNELEVVIDENADLIAFIDYSVEDGRYLVQGMRGDGYMTPDDPDTVEGDYDVNITGIEIYSEGDAVSRVEDNGMVAAALKDAIYVDEDGLDYQDDFTEYDDDSDYI